MLEYHEMKKDLPIEKAHRLISPRIVYIVTTLDKQGRVNAAVFSNLTSVSIDPQRLVMAIYKKWDSIPNLRAVKEFVVNVPSKDLLDQVWICGDKYAGNPIPAGVSELKIAGLTELNSEKVKPPRIKECYGHLECIVEWIKDVGDHFLVLGTVVHASFTQGYIDADLITDISKAQPLMNVSQDIFTYPSTIFRVERGKISRKVREELNRMKIKLPKHLKIYEEKVLSKND